MRFRMLLEMLACWLRPTPDRAACLIIGLSEFLGARGCREMADYLRECAKCQRGAEEGRGR